MRLKLAPAACLFVGLALTACSGNPAGAGGSAAPPHRPNVVTASVSSSSTSTTVRRSTPARAYSFDGSVPAPLIVNGDDEVAVLRSLLAYGAWLAAHRPDPKLVNVLSSRTTDYFKRVERNVSIWARYEKRGYEVKSRPDEITVLDRRTDVFTARVVQYVSSQRIVNKHGVTTSERKLDRPLRYLALVVRVNGRWLLAALDEQR